MTTAADKIFSKIRVTNETARKALAEFLGTFILIVSVLFTLLLGFVNVTGKRCV